MSMDSKSKWKPRNKNRFLKCFTSPVNDFSYGHTKCSTGEEPVFAFISLEKNKEVVAFPTIFPPLDTEEEEEYGGRHKSNGGRRLFSRAVKTVFLVASLAKKKKKLMKKKSLESNYSNNVISDSENFSIPLKKSLMLKDLSDQQITNSNVSSSRCSSTFAASTISSSTTFLSRTCTSRSSSERQSPFNSNS
ncbi:hypothetical protein O6P43_029032 [Quillaja saponaria]|uniref:Uncharacterized protein n=1 Tax=Quillaja saponaria TaxID=32244 RepID=A0AAD7KZ43_QUISA|nr:hypothetical protein O6P43_029032 [Quillaja saponaria]